MTEQRYIQFRIVVASPKEFTVALAPLRGFIVPTDIFVGACKSRAITS
jgi:hypothetical protein